jgi:hypothetical protein
VDTVNRSTPSTSSWASWREALTVALLPGHLRATIGATAVVGTILVAINQGDVLLRGQIGAGLLAKILLTYVVPFLVSNYGLLAATHRRSGPPGDRSRSEP